ncbi:hypothetical protein B0T12DRAFT_428541 [Alternaria alternata]|nr:hypothetical protein B0T12DRAFT_428541 [Alternaria alternata]
MHWLDHKWTMVRVLASTVFCPFPLAAVWRDYPEDVRKAIAVVTCTRRFFITSVHSVRLSHLCADTKSFCSCCKIVTGWSQDGAFLVGTPSVSFS